MKRQGFLFVIAIVIPCVLLIGLSVRMFVQERELADKRAADERRQLAGHLRQHLLTYLERIKLDALTDRARPPAAVALIATIDGDRLVLPWDSRSDIRLRQDDRDEPFGEAIRAAERDEFATHEFDRAADAYRRAISLGRSPEQQAAAQLGLARTLANAGRKRDAVVAFRQLLRHPASVLDDEAVPFVLYAARGLVLHASAADEEALPISEIIGLAQDVAGHRSTSPAALYMTLELVDHVSAPPGSTRIPLHGDLRRAVEARIQDAEQAQALQNAWPTLAAGTVFSADTAVWLTFGSDDQRCLVTLTPLRESEERVLLAVRSAPALATFEEQLGAEPRASFAGAALNTRAEGELLGKNFPGLSLVLPSVNGTTQGRQGVLQRTFFLGALFLVLSVALSGGYLFWRDVQRDVRLSTLRSQFVASVSHELKTPLTAIRMFAETLRMGRSPNPASRDEYLDTIVNESERLTRLVNNVLDFSKIEQGRKIYHLQPQSLAAVVRSAVRTMQYPLSQRGFALHTTIDDTVPDIAVDSDALEQAILNLLSNAMKYSGSSRVIDLQVRREGNEAIVAVTDQGLGIAPSEHTKIFEKFYRAANTGEQSITGTGLGLTLVEHTARAHGGRVTVRSAPGEGSTFAIVLPF